MSQCAFALSDPCDTCNKECCHFHSSSRVFATVEQKLRSLRPRQTHSDGCFRSGEIAAISITMFILCEAAVSSGGRIWRLGIFWTHTFDRGLVAWRPP